MRIEEEEESEQARDEDQVNQLPGPRIRVISPRGSPPRLKSARPFDSGCALAQGRLSPGWTVEEAPKSLSNLELRKSGRLLFVSS